MAKEGINRSISIPQPSIFGRIGTGIGKGLAEQLPKEIERNRLAAGLRELEGQKDLTPFQQFARLSSIPGITPQMIQSGSELLKQQGIRNAYARNRQADVNPIQTNIPSSNLDVQYNQLPGQIPRNAQNIQTIPENLPRNVEAISYPPAASENPLSEKYIPSGPWTQARHEEAINEAFDRGIATNFNEANAYANQQKQIFESTPEEYRKQLDYKKSIDKQVDDTFDKHLQTRLQKEGTETYGDVPGDLQLNIKKQARNAVARGKMTPDQAAEYYSKKALDLVKDKGRVLEIANRDIIDRISPYKKEETLKNLINIGKSYSDMGSSEDYYNLLRTDTLEPNGRQNGMGLSPGGAAIIAYPRTENVKNLIKNAKSLKTSQQLHGVGQARAQAQSTRAFAEDLSKVMTPQDSFLAIARQMKQTYDWFDEAAFFDYLRENRENYSTNPRLTREVNQGVSDFFPNWRDIGLFPAFTKSVAND